MRKYYYTPACWLFIIALPIFLLNGCNQKQKQVKLAKLTINTTPANAQIYYLNGKKICSATPFHAKKVKPKSYILKIAKDDYQPVWQKITLNPGENKVVDIKLNPMHGSTLIVSRPSKAKVIMNGRTVGVTPLILNNLSPGTYSAEINKPGNSIRTIEWKVKNTRPQKLIISLDSSIGRLSLNSTPSHAKIYLNGQARGFTPYKAELEEGRYRIKLKLQGFAEFEDSVMIVRDKTVSRKFTLLRQPGTLQITTLPAKASVYINDRPYGNSPVTASGLAPGKYTVRVAKHGFDPASRQVYADAGQTTNVSFSLTRNTGGIDLTVNPPGTTIYLNGKLIGVTKRQEYKLMSKVIHLRGLSSGTYLVVAAHKRAVPDKKKFMIKVTKGKISRPKPINLWVANAVLKLKDEKEMIGLLYYETKDKISFGPEPGVKIEHPRSKVEYLKLLKDLDQDIGKDANEKSKEPKTTPKEKDLL